MSENEKDINEIPEDREPLLPDDGHKQWEWKTKYNDGAWKHIRIEAIYLAALLFVGIILLILNYTGILYSAYIHITCEDFAVKKEVFLKELYCAIFGLLGGIVYGIKILYKAVARGKWHIDRLLWRLFTPWVSLVLSIVIASMMSGSILPHNNYIAISIGFFAGYFSESAIGKLYAIAKIMFS